MTEERTFTYTSPDGRVVVVTRVPTYVSYNIDGVVLGESHSAKVSKVLKKFVPAALVQTEPDTVMHLKWDEIAATPSQN